MRQTDRPKNEQKCANETCGHPFGKHYVTHGGEYGCSGAVDPARDGPITCYCQAFTMTYTYPNPNREPAA